MDAQAQSPEKELRRPKLTDAESRWLRRERLRRLTREDLEGKVRGALTSEWEEGLRPDRVRLRRRFARHAEPLAGAFSDRRLPPPEARPPAARLMSPSGSALETALSIYFVSQCSTKPGRRPTSTRPVLPRGSAGPRPWADLVAMPSDRRRPGTPTYVSTEENRFRQIAGSLARLAKPDVRLLDFPNAMQVKGKYEGFRVLDESGELSSPSKVLYVVPAPADDVFGLPASFFLNGWHLALSDAEMVLLLSLASHLGVAGPWPADVAVTLDGETRIRRHGLSPDAYATHAALVAFGVLEVTPDPRRRPNGTYMDLGEDERPMPHRMRIVESGFDRPAVLCAMAGLQDMGVQAPSRPAGPARAAAGRGSTRLRAWGAE